MKKYTKPFLALALMSFIVWGCDESFLDRPPEGEYVVDQWYETPEQLELAVNPLYGGVWFDFQRSWLNIGDVMAGVYYKGDDDAFFTFSVNQATTGVQDAYASLWMAVAYSNSVIENIRTRTPEDIDEEAKNTYLGEALVWKSMAYFFLVRGWGAVPIIVSNTETITSGNANALYRNRMEDVYEYIVRLLQEAIELLPETNKPGRINKYSAHGLLAKVYLTRSGLTRSGLNGDGSRNQEDLDLAAEHAGIVINESGLQLEPDFFELFRISGNTNPENLISWSWIAVDGLWGSQNAIQADLAVQQLTGVGDGWGTWTGPSIFLQGIFGEDATLAGAENRVNDDVRRKSTMMMDGDFYSDLQRDKGGLEVVWDGGPVFQCPVGAWARKHVVGNQADHEAQGGGTMYFMKTNLATHILRLADVYLVYAEAILGNADQTSNAEALKAYNAVRARSIPGHTDATVITFDDIFAERHRELAFEGDLWYDYVRLYYYKPAEAISRLSQQERGSYSGDAANPPITLNSVHYTPTSGDFFIPVPEVDISKNPNLLKDPVPFDFDQLD